MIKDIFELQNPWRNLAYSFTQKHRAILPTILDNLPNPKIIGLIGSRQVGKSSIVYLLIKHLIEKNTSPENIFYFNLDDLKLHDLFDNIPNFFHFIAPGNSTKYIFIDEIQRLKNPGLFLKEIYDLQLNIKIIYSGSSQLEIKSKLKEHLVGRARQFEIQRLSFNEYLQFNQPITKEQALEEMLIYGAYPATALARNYLEKKLTIKDIHQSYIEKDLVDFLRIANIEVFNKLLILLANQIGSLLNVGNLSKALRASRQEINGYINILEQTFITKRIYPFHQNYKKEIIKTPKLYFMDLGLRNYMINNFNPIYMRQDNGDLFENFYFTEMLAGDFYGLTKINFWRTTNQTEIDFIRTGEQREAFEVKWNKKTMPKSFATLKKYYPDITPQVITREDFL